MLTISQFPPSLQSLYQSYLARRAAAARLDETMKEYSSPDVEGFSLALSNALDAVQARQRHADTFAEALTNTHIFDTDDE